MIRSLIAAFAMLRESVAMSMSNILSNRMRSFLTILGILIGVTAVIALITTVNGFSGTLTSTFTSLGAGTLSVSVSGNDLKSGLTAEELDTLTQMDIIEGITPSVSLNSRVSRGGTYKTGISVSGKNSYYFRTNDVMVRGRALNIVDENNRSYVCLINQNIIDAFFFGLDPVGESIYIAGITFLVVGIFDSDNAGSSITQMMGGNADILIPYTTALKLSNSNMVTSFTVYLVKGTDSEAAAESIGETMDPMFSYEEDCYRINTMSSIESTMKELMSMITALLAGIASIALVVGGIGIMNMMLTSVSERTSEIGLKKAMGALPGQIQMQFLIESFLLSMIGGICGVVLGLILSLVMCNIIGTDFTISVDAIVLGTTFSAVVGIVFGWAPARKASRLNPIDALRSV